MKDKRDDAGKFIKGNKINKGRVPSTEQRQKQSEKMSGRVESDEHKEKIRKGMLASEKSVGRPKGGVPWNKGIGIKKKRFINDAKFKTGSMPWNKGKKLSKEMIERMVASHKNITQETRTKMSEAKKGKHHSAEVIKKMLTRRTPTSLEKKFLGIVEKNGLPYRFVGDGSFMIGRKNPDFININGDKIAIEVYSLYYKLRNFKTLNEWKEDRIKVFKEYGWEVLFFDAIQVNEINILEKLKAAE